jgi:WD40 repeat protein
MSRNLLKSPLTIFVVMTSRSDESGDGICMTKLKGHQGSVLCLDLSLPTRDDTLDHVAKSPCSTSSLCSTSTSLLLSGSEDHTARVWDVREHRRRACLCVQTSGDVLSAMFAPNTLSDPNISSSMNRQLSSPFAMDYTIYLAVDNTVVMYDLRQISAPIVRHDAPRRTVLQHQDEVNQISLAFGCIQNQQPKYYHKRPKKGGNNRKAKKSNDVPTNCSSNSLYLAACDDAGTVRFVDVHDTNTTSIDTSTILHHDSEGIAVVPTCAIRPRPLQNNGMAAVAVLELASGGSDCKIHLWDLSKPKCVNRIRIRHNVVHWIYILISYFSCFFTPGDRHHPSPLTIHLLSRLLPVVPIRANLKFVTLHSFIP